MSHCAPHTRAALPALSSTEAEERLPDEITEAAYWDQDFPRPATPLTWAVSAEWYELILSEGRSYVTVSIIGSQAPAALLGLADLLDALAYWAHGAGQSLVARRHCALGPKLSSASTVGRRTGGLPSSL